MDLERPVGLEGQGREKTCSDGVGDVASQRVLCGNERLVSLLLGLERQMGIEDVPESLGPSAFTFHPRTLVVPPARSRSPSQTPVALSRGRTAPVRAVKLAN